MAPGTECAFPLPRPLPMPSSTGKGAQPSRSLSLSLSLPQPPAMAPNVTSTASHYRRVCFMKVVSNSPQNGTKGFRTRTHRPRACSLPNSWLRVLPLSCRCHRSHHFRCLPLLSCSRFSSICLCVFALWHFCPVKRWLKFLLLLLLLSSLPAHLRLWPWYLFKIKHFACPANQKFVFALQSANRAAVSGCGWAPSSS